MKNNEVKSFSNQEGATMIEYAIMVGLIAMIVIFMVTGVGQRVNSMFSTANSAMTNSG